MQCVQLFFFIIAHPLCIFYSSRSLICQWCDGEVMKVIHQIISSKSAGSSCFFVGSYRSNEVSPDHAVFHLMENLASSKVATQKLLLDGVKVEDLNTLISDSLRTFPRLTRGLSAIIHEKTEGSKSKSCVHLDLTLTYVSLPCSYTPLAPRSILFLTVPTHIGRPRSSSLQCTIRAMGMGRR